MIEGTNVENQSKIQILSDSVAILLLFVYVVGIIFTFFTHKHLFVLPHSNSGDEHNEHDHKHWSKKKSFLMLGVSMVGIILVSEILVGSVEETSREFGFGEMFVGAIIVGIVGNAAEHGSAIVLARKGKMDLSIGIAAGSGTQIALFVVPILVLVGIVLGQPFTLEFTLY